MSLPRPAAGGRSEIALAVYHCPDTRDTGCVAVSPQLTVSTKGWTVSGSATNAPQVQLAVTADSVGHVVTPPPSGGVTGTPTAPVGDVAISVALQPSSNAGVFTTRKGENEVHLRADPKAAAAGGEVEWHITGIAPVEGWVITADPGQATTVTLSAPRPTRWAAVPHPGTLAKKVLAFQVIATSSVNGHTYTSAPFVVQQDEVSAIRQEYLDLGVAQGVPSRSAFVPASPASPSLTGQQANNGDYHVLMANSQFVAGLDSLKAAWGRPTQWQINGFYRNPVHNQYHVDGGKSSGTVPASWHQYGCAADLQVFPSTSASSSAAQDSLALSFWHALAGLAQDQGFRVEPLVAEGHAYSGLGHVHVERRCPP